MLDVSLCCREYHKDPRLAHCLRIYIADDMDGRDTVDDVRALNHHAIDWDPDDATPAVCRAGCEEEGYAVASLEHGRECWCGNTINDNAYPVPVSNCDSNCTGDASQSCGGYGYMSLYAINGYEFTIGGPVKVIPEGIIEVSCYE